MDIQTKKWNVMQKVMAVEQVSLIEKIEALLEEEMIVGHTSTGEPLTRRLYNERLARAEEQIEAGRFISQEDLEKESTDW